MDVDNNWRLCNVFWGRCQKQSSYESFNEEVTFGITNLTNRYQMPFAPFIGINHHAQSILLGCGLLSGEDTMSFVWLFQQWLTSMSGIHPKAIITDQCQALQAAIQVVFPTIAHRQCVWHITNKISTKLQHYDEAKEIELEYDLNFKKWDNKVLVKLNYN